jgi:hypothetical protein
MLTAGRAPGMHALPACNFATVRQPNRRQGAVWLLFVYNGTKHLSLVMGCSNRVQQATRQDATCKVARKRPDYAQQTTTCLYLKAVHAYAGALSLSAGNYPVAHRCWVLRSTSRQSRSPVDGRPAGTAFKSNRAAHGACKPQLCSIPYSSLSQLVEPVSRRLAGEQAIAPHDGRLLAASG